jgi:hypothetical protein
VTPGRFVAAMVPFFAALLWLDRYFDRRGQLLLGAATWLVLLLAARTLPAERRAQVAIVVVAATCAELTGSILWGVYSYRLGNLPSFVPPAHGLVYLTGLSLSRVLAGRERALVGVALAGALGWGLAGLTVLPRLDVAGAIGVPLLAVFLWRSASRGVYAGVFLAVAALELYGTAVGTWQWHTTLPGLGIPDGNPPSGAASGYVCFDVVALTLTPWLLARWPWNNRACGATAKASLVDADQQRTGGLSPAVR